MNDNALHELMRREADRAPLGDGDDLRRGTARLRRHRAIVGAGGTGLAAVALVAGSAILPNPIGQSDLQPAPNNLPAAGVTHNADGTITATVRYIKDVADLETQLGQQGVPTDAVFSRAGKVCEQPRFTPAPNEGAVVKGIDFHGGEGGEWFGITIDPDALRPGQTLVIQTARSQLGPVDGGGASSWGDASVAKGAVEPCHQVANRGSGPPPFPHYHHK
jgi:hypothetical protein